MPIAVGQLAYAPVTRVSCSKAIDRHDDPASVKFNLVLQQEHDDQWLSSRWRLYQSLQLDELPIRFAETRLKTRGSNAKGSNKCHRFKVETGQFYLELLGYRNEIKFEVDLLKLDQHSYSASSVGENEQRKGGSIKVVDFRATQLYLDQGLKLSGPITWAKKRRLTTSSGRGLYAPEQLQREIEKGSTLGTVQILHDHNNHVRKNNWMFDIYASWLKHEYRSQLNQLFGKSLADRVSTCFDNRFMSKK